MALLSGAICGARWTADSGGGEETEAGGRQHVGGRWRPHEGGGPICPAVLRKGHIEPGLHLALSSERIQRRRGRLAKKRDLSAETIYWMNHSHFKYINIKPHSKETPPIILSVSHGELYQRVSGEHPAASHSEQTARDLHTERTRSNNRKLPIRRLRAPFRPQPLPARTMSASSQSALREFKRRLWFKRRSIFECDDEGVSLAASSLA